MDDNQQYFTPMNRMFNELQHAFQTKMFIDNGHLQNETTSYMNNSHYLLTSPTVRMTAAQQNPTQGNRYHDEFVSQLNNVSNNLVVPSFTTLAAQLPTFQSSSTVFSPTVKHDIKNADSKSQITQWKGDFERRSLFIEPSIFCKKIFVGGISRHMNEEDILNVFKQYDSSAVIEWPETRTNVKASPKGYLHIILSSSDSVKRLLHCCDLVIEGGCETFNLVSSFRNNKKLLQVIPWLVSDSYHKFKNARLNHENNNYTVFIGALHGRMHAKAIAHMFNDIFGDVFDVSIDTDQHSYPTGSGRVSFKSENSYKSAIFANFVQIESKKVSKRIQIEPCIDRQRCCSCSEEDVPNFCREPECFDYFCNHCWLLKHNPSNGTPLEHHPIRRKSKNAI